MAIFNRDFIPSLVLAVLLGAAFATSLFMQGYQDPHYFAVLALLAPALLLSLFRPAPLSSPLPQAGGGTEGGGRLAVPSSGPALCILLLWALNAVAFAFSTVPFTSQIAFCIFSVLPLAFFAAHGMAAAVLRPLLVILGAVTSILAAIAVYHNLTIADGPYHQRAMWPMLNPNALAAVLNLGFLPLAGVAMASRGKIRIFSALLALLAFAGLWATDSRGAILGAVLGLAVLFAFMPSCPSLKEIGASAVSLTAIAVVLPLLSGSGIWARIARLANPAEDHGVHDRLSLLRASWKMFMDHPWIGTGPGTFSFYYPAYREPLGDRSYGHFAHFDPLQMGVEIGFLGPVLFYALLIAILIRTIEAMGTARDSNVKARILIPFATLLAVAVHAHICFPLYLMPVLLACGVLLAVWHSATVEALGNGIFTLNRRLPAIGGAGIVMALMLTLSGTAALGGIAMQKALKLWSGDSSTEEYLVALMRADKIGPESFIDPEIELARLNLRLLDSMPSASEGLKSKTLTETKTLLDTAAHWNKAWAEIDFLRGRVALMEGQEGQALAIWGDGLKKNPTHSATRKQLVIFLRDKGYPKEAATVALEGLKYPHSGEYRDFATSIIKAVRP